MTAILQEIISILVAGISGIATGVGQGLTTLAQTLFLGTEPGSLSVFGGLVVVFAGISLAIGLCRWVVDWITSLGARNRSWLHRRLTKPSIFLEKKKCGFCL